MRMVPVSRLARACVVSGSALALTALTACGTNGSEVTDDAPVTIATTTSINADILSSAFGSSANVVAVVPDGADPHTFSPTPKAVAELNGADVIVVNGVETEESVAAVVKAAEEDGTPVCGFADPGSDDTHFHTDPGSAAAAVRDLTTCLGDSTALERESLSAQADEYARELEQLDAEIEETLGVLPPSERLLVTGHDSFHSFAERHGFEVVGVLSGDAHDQGTGAADLLEVANTIEDRNIKAVFIAPNDSRRVAETVIGEVDAHDVVLSELLAGSFDTDETGVEDYQSMIRYNAAQLIEALS